MSSVSGRLLTGVGLAGITAAVAGLPLEALASAVFLSLVVAAPAVGLAGVAFSVPFGSRAAIDLGAGALTAAPVLLAVVAFVWTLAALASKRLPGLERTRRAWTVAWPLALLIGIQLAAAWRAPDLPRAALEVARWVVLGLAFVLAAELAVERRTVAVVVLAVLAAGALEAWLGVRASTQGAGPEAFALLSGGGTRAFGSFGQPNPFGAYMNTVWPLGAGLALGWLAYGSVPLGLALAGGIGGSVCALGLVLSYSRGAWMGAAAAAVVMGGVLVLRAVVPRLLPRAAVLAWLALLGVLAVFAVGPLSAVPSGVAARAASAFDVAGLADVADAEVDDANFATVERGAHWQAALAMWRDRPWLGQGPGHYEVVYDRYRLPRWPEALGHAHNMYLQAMAETGLLGLVAYGLLIVGSLALGLRAAFRPSSGVHGALGVGAAGMVAALAVHSVVDHPYVHDLAAQVGLVLGLVAASKDAL